MRNHVYNEAQSLCGGFFPHEHLDVPDLNFQSTEEKNTFRLGAPVWCRPRTLGREKEYLRGERKQSVYIVLEIIESYLLSSGEWE